MPRRTTTQLPAETLAPDSLISITKVSESDARGLVDVSRGVRIVLTGPSVRPRRVERPIATTIDEARQKGWDYWDPRFNNGKGSWIRAGVKAERDYDDNLGIDFIDYLSPEPQETQKDGIN